MARQSQAHRPAWVRHAVTVGVEPAEQAQVYVQGHLILEPVDQVLAHRLDALQHPAIEEGRPVGKAPLR